MWLDGPSRPGAELGGNASRIVYRGGACMFPLMVCCTLCIIIPAGLYVNWNLLLLFAAVALDDGEDEDLAEGEYVVDRLGVPLHVLAMFLSWSCCVCGVLGVFQSVDSCCLPGCFYLRARQRLLRNNEGTGFFRGSVFFLPGQRHSDVLMRYYKQERELANTQPTTLGNAVDI
mmetsp:Transcript_70235/g.131334  ORF Transcript_70235/g.131334 Transcript_70235/m.131334 type:complete len:173 (-) Transcript_70235:19-537(-)